MALRIQQDQPSNTWDHIDLAENSHNSQLMLCFLQEFILMYYFHNRQKNRKLVNKMITSAQNGIQ